MRTTFYIELNMRTAKGIESYGCFELGEDRDFAVQVFSKLEGQPEEEGTSVLQMDLVEKYRGLPVDIQVISCSIEQLCHNTRTITRELFKRRSLDEKMV